MSDKLKQKELDLFEEHILSCLFQDPQCLRMKLFLRGFITPKLLNDIIRKFETVSLPYLTENGYVDGKKLSNLVAARFSFAKEIEIPDFRLIELSRGLEPLLKAIGAMLQ